MAKGDIIVGLDIGTTKVCTIIAEVAGGDGVAPGMVDILGVGVSPSLGIRRGVVVDIEQTVRAIRDSVDKAQRMAGAEIHSVIVGVTGEHIASLNSRGVVAITHADREVTQEDVDRVMDNSRVIVLPPDREIIHSIARGYSLDGQNGIRSPVGMSGTRLEVETHIVTGATTFLRNVATCVERAGLHVEEMVLEPIATGESVLMDAEKNLGVALLDIGGGTSDLAIFRNGDIFYSAVVPVGGDYVTKDISAGLRVSYEEAERVKLEHGVARTADTFSTDEHFSFTHLGDEASVTLPVRELAELIEPRIQELFRMVEEEINRANCAGRLPAGLVLSGGGALLSGLRHSATDITGLPTRVGFPGGNVRGLADSVQAPSFATAVGLVGWGSHTHGLLHTHRESGRGFVGAVAQWLRRLLRDVDGVSRSHITQVTKPVRFFCQ